MVSLFVSSSLAENTVELRFISFPKEAQPSHLELLVGEAKTINIQVPTNRISQTYQVPEMATWTVGTSENTGAEFIFKNLGTAQAISSDQQLILILQKDDATEGLRLIPVDTSRAGFCGGRHLLVNGIEDQISGVFGGRDFSIDKGEYAILGPERKSGENASAAIAIYLGNKERPFFSSKWRVNPKARSVIFFYHDPKTRHIRLHSIRDYLSH